MGKPPPPPSRADELIRTLELAPHPEGGHFSEVYRSEHKVHPAQGARAAITTIYYLLTAGDHSAWHVVQSDEVWHHHEGDALELFSIDPNSMRLSRARLGATGDDQQPIAVVPAGHWQAARSTGAFSLMGCDVSPGFDFDDFGMLRDRPEQAASLQQAFPDLAHLL